MTQFKITPKAYQSLQEIGRYTKSQWGIEKRDKYLNLLDKRFHWLAENPLLGRHRNEIQENLYSYREGSHVIFYTIMSDHIQIIGIPHIAMDVINYLDH